MSSVLVPLAPSIIRPGAEPSREQLREERRMAAAVEAWLAHQTRPEPAVIWYPGWSERRSLAVEDRDHLARLVGQLGARDYAGIRLPSSSGPRAQVLGGGGGEFCIELHPRNHNGEPGGMYFERVVPVTAASAGTLGWAWVRREALPANFRLEPRVVPEGWMFDQPL